MKGKIRKINCPTIIVTLIVLFLFGYSIFDATVTKPKIDKRVEYVVYEFDSLKTFLDSKIPEIEAELIKHDAQIKRQDEQLDRLQELAESIRDK